jgi:hypothetical protein
LATSTAMMYKLMDRIIIVGSYLIAVEISN